jgi:hypothetical protein
MEALGARHTGVGLACFDDPARFDHQRQAIVTTFLRLHV